MKTARFAWWPALVMVGTAAVLSAAESPPVAMAGTPELAVEDFDFNGPLGSEGAKIERVGPNHFRVTLAAAPNQPTWANNLQFRIVRHARGSTPRLDVAFNAERPEYVFDEYFHSWSYDGKTWHPVQWQPVAKADKGRRATIVLPTFTEDSVIFGLQVPLPYETLAGMIDAWAKNPCVKVHILGQTPGGRNLYRLEVTDPQSLVAPEARWVHYFTQQHPGEHNARWRMVGMLEWLLSEAGADCRRRSLCHFVLMMSPDAPSKGWYRVNAAGVDMNRSYRAEGADPKAQTVEPYTLQKDLEGLMASPAPVTDLWSMHTAGGTVDPILTPGPEMGRAVGPWTDLNHLIQRADTHHLIRPVRVPASDRYGAVSWTGGPHRQFGITAMLGEGGGAVLTKEENLESGRILIKALAEYYKGARPGVK